MPLLPIQLLFINLVGDSLPCLALSVDHAAKDIMSRRAIDPNQGIFTRSFSTRVAIQALILGAMTILAYVIGLNTSVDVARTMTFAVMIFSQFVMIFSVRSGNKLFVNRFFSNRWLWLTIFLVIGLTLMVMLVPSMQSLFHLATLSVQQWWTTIGLTLGVLLLSEISKIFTK